MSNDHVNPVFGRLLGAIMPAAGQGKESDERRKPVALCLECNENPAVVNGRCERCHVCVAGAKA